MTAMRTGLVLATIVLLGASACRETTEAANAGSALEQFFGRGTLTLTADDGSKHQFDIYLATNYEQQRRGLMFVRSMPATTGMLFVYDEPGIRSMWMKNTYIPLDMVYARADGSVSSVIHDTQPLSLTSQRSVEPVVYVLELNAGTARRLQIGKRSRFTWQSNDAGKK